MKPKLPLLIILGFAILLTTFGYIIDTDPPYANVWHTVFEFIMMTGFIFTLIAGPYMIISFISYSLRNKKKA